MVKSKSNDQVILDTLLNKRKQARAPEMTPEDYFEVFVSDETLRDFGVSDAEVDFGITGGGADGGIDSFYTFVNRELVMDVEDIPDTKDPAIDLVIIQSTTSAKFSEDRIARLHDTLKDLLEFDVDREKLMSLYNESIISAADIFRASFLKFADMIPTPRIKVIYASEGVVPLKKARARTKAKGIETLITKKFRTAQVDFQFLGARGLVELAHRKPAARMSVDLEEVIAVSSSSYIALVRLSKLNEIISDGKEFRADIFDANVRDYERNVAVNLAIAASLADKGSAEDFWWLNNGVTIITTEAGLAGKRLSLRDPQIVNGFQTSTEIFKYFQEHRGSDKRTVLVRILVTSSEDVRAEIIRATNSQTAIGPFALRATDPLHRGLETYLGGQGLYYERRKNHYKNRGMPRLKIVTISDLAQAMMAVLLFLPDDSRARPASLIRDDKKYERVFDASYEIKAFLNAIILLHKIRDYLDVKDLPRPIRNNFRFHMAMVIAVGLGVKKLDAQSLAMSDVNAIDTKRLDAAFKLVGKVFKAAVDSGQILTQDLAAKSPRVTEELVRRLSAD